MIGTQTPAVAWDPKLRVGGRRRGGFRIYYSTDHVGAPATFTSKDGAHWRRDGEDDLFGFVRGLRLKSLTA